MADLLRPRGGWLQFRRLSSCYLFKDGCKPRWVFEHGFKPGNVWFAETQIEAGRGLAGFIGLCFMARHVVTFDFPKGVLYLRSIRARAGS